MRPLLRYVLTLVAILLLAGGTAAHADTFPYQTLDYPGAQHTFAHGINNASHIVGSYNGNAVFHADTARGYLLSGGNYTPIDYSAEVATVANGINNTGQISGTYLDATIGRQGYLLSGGNYTDINYPCPRAGEEVYGINDAGQIVGCYPTSYWHAFLFSAEVYTNIDPPWGWSFWAAGINNAGQIVGGYYTGGSYWHGFLKSGVNYIQIDYPDASGTDANGINNTGQIVGTYYDGAGLMHGFLLSDGVYKSLDIPGALQTTAWGINDNGIFVGSYQDSDGIWHGFVSGVSIDIDIKPGDSENSINPKKQGTIPVAILSTPDFYAPDQVDLNSLTFGRTGNETSLDFCTIKDVNGDGVADVVGHFDAQATGFQKGDTTGYLKGETVNGIPLSGSDSVLIVTKK